MKKEEYIKLSLYEAEEILKELNLIIVSLHNMGSFYSENIERDYEVETTKFIDENKVTSRLSYIRRVLSEKYYPALTEEERDKYYDEMTSNDNNELKAVRLHLRAVNYKRAHSSPPLPALKLQRAPPKKRETTVKKN